MPDSIRHKQLIVATVLLATLGISSVLCIANEDYQAWNDFKTQFNKTYEKQEDEQRRLKIFLENKRYIKSQKTKSQSS